MKRFNVSLWRSRHSLNHTQNHNHIHPRRSHRVHSVQRCATLSSCLLSVLAVMNAQASIAPGDLVITELMANPASVSDTLGEWFEVYNRSGSALDLSGLTISDNGSNSHAIASSIIVNADSYFVFGRNADSSVNGGYTADYQYSNFTLGNSSDDIILSFSGTVIDSVSYAGDSNFGIAGVSTELTATGFLATPTGFIYGAGDTGTPGAAGSDPTLDLGMPSPVPIPAAGWLMGSALAGLALRPGRRAGK